MNLVREWTSATPYSTETLSEVYVVVEHQGVGRVACDSIDGHLITYGSIEEAQKEAKAIIEELNSGRTGEEWGYDHDSWGAASILDVRIGDNQDHIIMPGRSCAGWESNRSAVINHQLFDSVSECQCMSISTFIPLVEAAQGAGRKED
tara:strand:+ start:431 stop:874 length:444 start_codon:yes stop_codon:yes gene_type:complete